MNHLNVIPDLRPVEELANVEIVAELVRAARVNEIKTVAHLRQVCQELFPDLPRAREDACLKMMARACHSEGEFQPDRRRPRGMRR
jgi:hypothetical protein